MKKPEVIELIRKHVNSGSRLYPLLDYTAKELLEYIDKKDEEIEFHKNNERIAIDCQNKLNEEIERLSKEVDMWNKKYNEQFDIINELEKYGRQRFNEYEAWKEECKNLCYINGITEMLDKLQELKGESNE